MGHSSLDWQDNAVIAIYLAGMIALGVWLGRRRKTDEDYFLAGRRMPWLAVGVSVIASILSSITYLSEPGEVWKSGVTHIFGKMLAIPFEMAIGFFICIPFLMRFRYTSVYEYLGDRFGTAARRLGVVLFVLMVVMWMGVVVNKTSAVLAHVSGWELPIVIAVVGLVATIYTMLGGLRAVIWTDVVQVTLLIGGGLFTIIWVIVQTGTWIPDWYELSVERLREQGATGLPMFSFDPTVRATVLTVAINMAVWHVCTHLSNQMTVQRYFSTSGAGAAQRSFVVGTILGVAINLMLMVTGLALLYYYLGQGTPVALDGGLDPAGEERDLIFPTFAIHRLPAGIGGGVLAALLAAAMSSIDSGINSIATVVTVEWSGHDRELAGQGHVRQAQLLTLAAGVFITIAAGLLDYLPQEWSIIDLLPRTFNAITAPLGGLFLIGMFLPRADQRAAVIGTLCGVLTSILIGYSRQLGLHPVGLSFTWIMPCAMLVTLTVAGILSLLSPGERPAAGLTWASRNASSERDHD